MYGGMVPVLSINTNSIAAQPNLSTPPLAPPPVGLSFAAQLEPHDVSQQKYELSCG